MEYSLFIKLAAEFVGTAVLMVFGNGAVANAELKNTKGYHAGWLNIAMGYGFGVMFPVLMFGGVSGAHINPAMTLAQAINGMFPWGQVLPYIIAQLLGAVVGQLIVYITYWPHYKDTEDANAILPIPHKGSSRWGEAWIPVVAPIAGAIVGAFLFKSLFA